MLRPGHTCSAACYQSSTQFAIKLATASLLTSGHPQRLFCLWAAQAAFLQCVSAHLCLPVAADSRNVLLLSGLERHSMVLCSPPAVATAAGWPARGFAACCSDCDCPCQSYGGTVCLDRQVEPLRLWGCPVKCKSDHQSALCILNLCACRQQNVSLGLGEVSPCAAPVPVSCCRSADCLMSARKVEHQRAEQREQQFRDGPAALAPNLLPLRQRVE